MSAITHLYAGVPVSDLDAGIDWYTRLFGRPSDMRAGEDRAPTKEVQPMSTATVLAAFPDSELRRAVTLAA